MKTITKIVLVGMLLFISCEHQYPEINPGGKKNLPRFAYSSLDKEEKLKNALEGFRRNASTTSVGARFRDVLKDINTDSIQKVLQSDNTNYTLTLTLKNGNSLSSFENVVFRRAAHGFHGFFVEYKSTVGLFNPENFTGTVSKYDLEGNLLQERFFEKGKPVVSKNGRVADFCTLVSMSKTCTEEVFDGWDHTTGTPIYKCGHYMIYLTFDCPEAYTPGEYSGYGTYIGDYYPGGGGNGGYAANISGSYDPLTETTTYQPDDPWGVSPPLPTSDELVQIARDIAAAEIESLLQVNPLGLIDLPCTEIQKWQNLASFRPPQSVVNKINTLKQSYPNAAALFTGNFDIQTLQNAAGKAVNLDYFSVTISQMPAINGHTLTPTELLNRIRTDLNSFVDTQYSSFSPYNTIGTGTNESALWNSTNPVNAIIHIEIPGQLHPLNPLGDDGSVICSDSQSASWKFTTISAPGDWSHPVSGTREFGFEANANGSYTFYTRGVDRITQSINDLVFESKTFRGSDSLWTSFQRKIKSFVTQNGGSAVKNGPITGRPDYAGIEQVLNGSLPASSLGCN
jgi:hypothetical protein